MFEKNQIFYMSFQCTDVYGCPKLLDMHIMELHCPGMEMCSFKHQSFFPMEGWGRVACMVYYYKFVLLQTYCFLVYLLSKSCQSTLEYLVFKMDIKTSMDMYMYQEGPVEG